MKVSFFYLFILLLLSQATVIAQTQLSMNVDLVANTITINNKIFTDSSTIEEYEKLLGKADRIEQKKGVDQIFAYDRLGLSLSLGKDSDIVNQLFITYIYDGDRKVAKEVFKGTLTVNNKVVQPQISREEMSKLANVTLEEVMNGYFLTPRRDLNLLLFYPQDIPYTALKQFGLIFSRQ